MPGTRRGSPKSVRQRPTSISRSGPLRTWRSMPGSVPRWVTDGARQRSSRALACSACTSAGGGNGDGELGGVHARLLAKLLLDGGSGEVAIENFPFSQNAAHPENRGSRAGGWETFFLRQHS